MEMSICLPPIKADIMVCIMNASGGCQKSQKLPRFQLHCAMLRQQASHLTRASKSPASFCRFPGVQLLPVALECQEDETTIQ